MPMGAGPTMGGPSPLLGPQMVGGELQLPNKVLYLQQVPEGTTESQLTEVFKRFAGFVEVRLVPNHPELAFAEYENEAQAAVARQATDGTVIQPEKPPKDTDGMAKRLKVSFSRH